jgi:hypothetical protein
MEVIRNLMRRQDATEKLAVGVFVVAALVALFRGQAHTLLAGVAFVLIVLGALPRHVALAFLVGALAMALLQTRRQHSGWEGFVDGSGAAVDVSGAAEDVSGAVATATPEEKATADKFESGPSPIVDSARRPMLPDNRERQEMLELGKPYRLPSEGDDGPYHLDAGTTFLNAYKALKPDQIAAMTRDTQELLATQKSLVAMLDSFGPLLKDMNKITGFFN